MGQEGAGTAGLSLRVRVEKKGTEGKNTPNFSLDLYRTIARSITLTLKIMHVYLINHTGLQRKKYLPEEFEWVLQAKPECNLC